MWLLFLPAPCSTPTLGSLVPSVGDETVTRAWPSPWLEGLVVVVI